MILYFFLKKKKSIIFNKKIYFVHVHVCIHPLYPAYACTSHLRTIVLSISPFVCVAQMYHTCTTRTHIHIYIILYIHYRRGIYFNIAPVNDATVHGPFFVINGLSSHTQILESFVLNVGCNFLHPFFFFS